MASWSRAERGPGRVLGAGGAGFRAGLRSWLALWAWAWAWAWSTGEPVAPPTPQDKLQVPGTQRPGQAAVERACGGLRRALLREPRASPAVRSARVRGGGQHRGDRAGLRAAQRAHVRGRMAGGVPRAGTALRCRAPRTETVIRASPPYGPRGTQGAVPGDADTQRSGGSRVWTPAWETRFPGRRAA